MNLPLFCGKCRFFCPTWASASGMNQHLHARLRDNRAGFNCWLISLSPTPLPFFNLVSCVFSGLFTWVILKVGWGGYFQLSRLPLSSIASGRSSIFTGDMFNKHRGSGVTPSMLMNPVWSSCEEIPWRLPRKRKNMVEATKQPCMIAMGFTSVVHSGQFYTSC